jgi:hypothetical protein
MLLLQKGLNAGAGGKFKVGEIAHLRSEIKLVFLAADDMMTSSWPEVSQALCRWLSRSRRRGFGIMAAELR